MLYLKVLYLFTGEFEAAKLCDFGVSVPLNSDGIIEGSSESFIGTECWAAPEALTEDGIITNKADIFSFGLVLWEMISLQVPNVDFLDFDDSLNGGQPMDTSADYILKSGNYTYFYIIRSTIIYRNRFVTIHYLLEYMARAFKDFVLIINP